MIDRTPLPPEQLTEDQLGVVGPALDSVDSRRPYGPRTFKKLARLIPPTTLQPIWLRVIEGDLCVWLRRRGSHETYPGQLSAPSFAMLGDEDFKELAERIRARFFASEPFAKDRLVGVYDPSDQNGRFIHIVRLVDFFSDFEGDKGTGGEWYPVDKLPDDVVAHHVGMIQDAAALFRAPISLEDVLAFLASLDPNSNDFKALIAGQLNRITSPKYGTELFDALMLKMWGIPFEAVALRVNSGTIEVYLRTRADNDTAYPGQKHSPGKVRMRDERADDVAARLAVEFGGVRIRSYQYIGKLASDEARGSMLSEIYIVELDGDPVEDEAHGWYPVDKLPGNMVDLHLERMIPHAVLAYCSDRRLPFRVSAKIEISSK
jgi:hypothetical protein